MAVLGTLEYLISIDSSKVSSGLNAAEGKVKTFGNKLSAWTVAKGQVLGGLIMKAGQATMKFVSGAVEESKAFDKSMSQVAATLGKSTKEIQNLSKFAREMGSKTAFTAKEAADGLNYMALAGYDAEKSMRMLPTVLNLAAAGTMELASASDMVTDAQSALGLTIEQTETLVDQMAKTSSKTNTSVSQLGDAILTVGGTAKMLKGGTTELNTVLGVLANAGIKGSEGGTALRNVLLSLSAPTSKASKALKKLKVDVFDKQGNMRSLPDIMSDMSKAMDGMTAKQRTDFINKIFNKRDLKSVEALLGMTVEDWAKLQDEIDESAGAADKMAKTQLDNLSGDMTIFGSALSEAKLALVEGLTPALRSFVKGGTYWITDLTKNFKEKGLAGAIDTARKAFDFFSRKMSRSKNPVVKFLGETLRAFRHGFTWQAFGSTITKGWNLIRDGFNSLGKLFFGENVDGTTKWPTWSDILDTVSGIWEGVKTGFSELGKLFFGENADGTTNWPTWETVSDAISKAWDGIKTGFFSLGKLIFGENADGTTNWPTWDTVKESVTSAWDTICKEAGKLKGFVFGDTADAADIFSTFVNNFTSLKNTVEQGAIDIGTWFFGEDNAETVVTAVKEISTAIEAIGSAILSIKVTEGITSFIGLFKEGGEFAKIFGKGGTLATFLSTNKIGLIIGAIAIALVEIIEHWDQIEPALKEFGGWIDQYVLEPIRQVGEWIDANIIKPIENVIAEFKKTFGLDRPKLDSRAQYELNSDVGMLNGSKDEQMQYLDKLTKKMQEAGYSAEQINDVKEAIFKSGMDESWVTELVSNMGDADETAAMLLEYLSSISKDWDVDINLKVHGELPQMPTQSYGQWKNDQMQKEYGHAKGLNTVPYDNYLASLHRGEMVLTKSQARQYREGGSGGGVDISGMAASIVAAVREGMAGASVNSYLDGKGVTDNVNRRTSNKLRARRFSLA